MKPSITTGLENIVGQSASTGASATKSSGKDDFMRLLTDQLKRNQELSNKTDPKAFAAHLAPFSSIEHLSDMNADFKSQGMKQWTLGYAQSVGMIGKEAVIASGNVVTANGPTTTLSYNLASDAQNVAISIFDKHGKLVETLSESNQPAGVNKATWNCSGVNKGNYTYQVAAQNTLGAPVPACAAAMGLVTAVSFKNNEILATVNGQEVPLQNILTIT